MRDDTSDRDGPTWPATRVHELLGKVHLSSRSDLEAGHVGPMALIGKATEGEWTASPQCVHPLLSRLVFWINDQVHLTSRSRRRLVLEAGPLLIDTNRPELTMWAAAVSAAAGRTVDGLLAALSTIDRSADVLAGTNLAGASLSRVTMPDVDLSHANLAGADLTQADLSRANLTGSNLAGATLLGAELASAQLVGANLAGAKLYRADLCDANLARATLRGAQLVGTNLTGAKLAEANLSGSNLATAVMDRADLRGANLSQAFMTRVKLTDATLSLVMAAALPAIMTTEHIGRGPNDEGTGSSVMQSTGT